MKITVQLTIDHENGQPVTTQSIVEFRRKELAMETLGLTLTESKEILKNFDLYG